MAAHLFIVHFPVALLLFGALTDLGATAMGNNALRMRGGQLIIAGGIAAFLAFVTGEGAKIVALNTTEVDLAALATHEQWGSVATWALLGVAIVRAMWRNRFEGPIAWLHLGLAVAAAALVTFITLSGTAVRHGL